MQLLWKRATSPKSQIRIRKWHRSAWSVRYTAMHAKGRGAWPGLIFILIYSILPIYLLMCTDHFGIVCNLGLYLFLYFGNHEQEDHPCGYGCVLRLH